MVETTKIRDVNGSKITSIPKTYWKQLNLNKGDTIVWSLDKENQVIHIKKLDEF